MLKGSDFWYPLFNWSETTLMMKTVEPDIDRQTSDDISSASARRSPIIASKFFRHFQSKRWDWLTPRSKSIYSPSAGLERFTSCSILQCLRASRWCQELIRYRLFPAVHHHLIIFSSAFRKIARFACPCSQISNKRQSFVTIDYSLHPICNSMFVADRWISYIRQYASAAGRWNFQSSAFRAFQALRSLCQLADESIKISLELFQSQLETIVQQFIALTTDNFLLTLKMIGNTTQANALLTGLVTNI